MCVYKKKTNKKKEKSHNLTTEMNICLIRVLLFGYFSSLRWIRVGRKIAFTSTDTFVNGWQSYSEYVYAPKTHFHFYFHSSYINKTFRPLKHRKSNARNMKMSNWFTKSRQPFSSGSLLLRGDDKFNVKPSQSQIKPHASPPFSNY